MKCSPSGPHQVDAINLGTEELLSADRAQVIMACGTGKTFVAQAISQNLSAKKLLILVPSLALISQTLMSWIEFGGVDLSKTILVCSDSYTENTSNEDQYTEVETPLRVTTECKEISKFIEAHSNDCIVFCTYHSSMRLCSALPIGYTFDLAIYDEAHRTAGRVDKSFSFLLKDHTRLHIQKRLFLTATPKELIIKDNDQTDYYSMDDENIYGRVAYRLTLKEAIENGIICDYEILISVLQDSAGEVNSKDENYLPSINAIELIKAMDKVQARKAFTYHSRVSEAVVFTQVCNTIKTPKTKPIEAFHVNGRMNSAERQGILKRFSGSDVSVVSNARCLSEGVDLPAVDLVGIMSPRDSSIDIVQIIGRALRKSPGKTKGYIFLPVRLEISPGEDISHAISKTSMSHVWKVIKAISEQDEELQFIFNAAQRDQNQNGRIGNFEWFDRIKVNAPDNIKEHFTRVLEIKVVERFSDSWQINYDALVEYHQEHGSFPPKTAALNKWLATQRALNRKNKLRPTRKVKLESIDAFKIDSWDENFDYLSAYKEQFGDCLVPMTYENSDGIKLGIWVNTQRNNIKKGTLRRDRINALESIGFVADVYQAMWDSQFKSAKQFKDTHGDLKISNKQVSACPELEATRTWLASQVKRYRKGTLLEERAQKLYALGLILDTSNKYEHPSQTPSKPLLKEDDWNDGFIRLLKYKKTFATCLVPSSFLTKDGYTLGQWVTAQRQLKKDGRLRINLEIKLRSIGFYFDASEKRTSNKKPSK